MRNRAESWTRWRRDFPNRNDLPMRTVAVKEKPGRLSQLANQAYVIDKVQEWFIVNTLVEVDKKKTDPASGGCPF